MECVSCFIAGEYDHLGSIALHGIDLGTVFLDVTVPRDDHPALASNLRYPDRVGSVRRLDRARRTDPAASHRPSRIAGIGDIRTKLDQHLGQAEKISIDIEAYWCRPCRLAHAAAARTDVSYASAQCTSSVERSNSDAMSVTNSPVSACSQTASVLTPLICGRPNRVSGLIRTGDCGSSWGRQPAAMSPSQVTRLRNESAGLVRTYCPRTSATRQKSGSRCASSCA